YLFLKNHQKEEDKSATLPGEGRNPPLFRNFQSYLLSVREESDHSSKPKLTPELLLSDDCLNFVLRYFPKNIKFRSRAREVEAHHGASSFRRLPQFRHPLLP
ncbi:hypothetical protein LINGRAHAP2_LOCUS25495, partial [Linum grandiflorum]